MGIVRIGDRSSDPGRSVAFYEALKNRRELRRVSSWPRAR